MNATSIREAVTSGLFVTIERDSTQWKLPVEFQFREREFTAWYLYDSLWAGDRLTFPLLSIQVVLVAHLRGLRTGGPFRERVNPWWRPGHLAVVAIVDCLACGTTAAHPADMPTGIVHDDEPLWVARTCITCGGSWRQEAEADEH